MTWEKLWCYRHNCLSKLSPGVYPSWFNFPFKNALQKNVKNSGLFLRCHLSCDMEALTFKTPIAAQYFQLCVVVVMMIGSKKLNCESSCPHT